MANDGSQYKFKHRFTPSEKDRNGPPPGVDPRTYVPTGLWSAECFDPLTRRLVGIGFGTSWEQAREKAAECAQKMADKGLLTQHEVGDEALVRHYSLAPRARRRRARTAPGLAS